MYLILISLHSLFRWLLLVGLCYAIYIAGKAYHYDKPFTKWHDAVRHWTATLAHIQLTIGFTLYFKSPIIKFFFLNVKEGVHNTEILFFALVHILLMFASIVMITIGSALAKRQQTDRDKFKTMLFWFSISLFVIFIAIPWPFSPFANRAYFKPF